MDANTEVIRQRMEETKARLSHKMEALEQQISDPFQLAGTATHAAASAARRAFHSLTETAKSADPSAIVRQQTARHPWIMLSSAAMLGYFASEIFKARHGRSKQTSGVVPAAPGDALMGSESGNGGEGNGAKSLQADVPQASSLWSRMGTIANRTMGRMTEEAVESAVSYLLASLIRDRLGSVRQISNLCHLEQVSPTVCKTTDRCERADGSMNEVERSSLP